MSDTTELAEQIAAMRKQKGLTQQALAEKLGMKQSQISELEAGKRNVRVGTLMEIARAVGLELVMVPRPLLPAVSYVLRSGEGKEKDQPPSQTSRYEFWNEN